MNLKPLHSFVLHVAKEHGWELHSPYNDKQATGRRLKYCNTWQFPSLEATTKVVEVIKAKLATLPELKVNHHIVPSRPNDYPSVTIHMPVGFCFPEGFFVKTIVEYVVRTEKEVYL